MSVEYRVDSKNRSEFLAALEEMGHERKRDGAFAWGVFEDAVLEGRYVETFLIESWLELRHLRQRVTNADRMIEDRILGLLNDAPQIAILVAPERRGGSRKWRFAGAGG